jgi:CheY-like chemotaxis protein
MPPDPARFLIIDDNGDSRMLLVKSLLRKFPDAVIQECQNGDTALRIAQTDMLTAIVAHRTFEYDGETLIGRLRAANQAVPIVMVSGYDRAAKAVGAGADAFLHYDEWLHIGNIVANAIATRHQRALTPDLPVNDLPAAELA